MERRHEWGLFFYIHQTSGFIFIVFSNLEPQVNIFKAGPLMFSVINTEVILPREVLTEEEERLPKFSKSCLCFHTCSGSLFMKTSQKGDQAPPTFIQLAKQRPLMEVACLFLLWRTCLWSRSQQCVQMTSLKMPSLTDIQTSWRSWFLPGCSHAFMQKPW